MRDHLPIVNEFVSKVSSSTSNSLILYNIFKINKDNPREEICIMHGTWFKEKLIDRIEELIDDFYLMFDAKTTTIRFTIARVEDYGKTDARFFHLVVRSLLDLEKIRIHESIGDFSKFKF